jgi:hypothetical protein
MTTSTPTITPTVTQSWLRTHERIVIVFLALLVSTWGLGKFLDSRAVTTEARAASAEQALSAQKSLDVQQASQTATVLAQYQSMVVALSGQNASLAASAAQRQATLAKDKATDSTLALPVLAVKLQNLGNAPDGSVSTTPNSVNFTQSGAVAVVQTLEEVPVLQATLKDTQTALAASAATQKQGDTVIADQAKQITGLNLMIIDQDKSCKAEITAVKAADRKSKFKWFKVGFVTGFLGGLYAGHAGL